ncbi:NAD(P)-binding Rossmann-fold domain [Escherichia coli]|uniref:NAD(P)-binding Rossmann-fold domain n=1 Tax=Escherichia coli TaxID=562 RepID=A0A377AYG0_ECOLX|nr:NAD(P)-binding Rossmann-fold domain [Escherichia coli]
MPQRILVLGASGYIGQHLVRTLSQQGHQILAAARHVDRLAKLQLANVSCHKVDLSWPDNLPALLQDIDTVYFLVHAWAKAAILSLRSARWLSTSAMRYVKYQLSN